MMNTVPRTKSRRMIPRLVRGARTAFVQNVRQNAGRYAVWVNTVTIPPSVIRQVSLFEDMALDPGEYDTGNGRVDERHGHGPDPVPRPSPGKDGRPRNRGVAEGVESPGRRKQERDRVRPEGEEDDREHAPRADVEGELPDV